MNSSCHQLRATVSRIALALGISLAFALNAASAEAQGPPPPGHFVDATEKLGIHFRQQASPTSKKYLLEAMGSGVALFDYDNDGRLDIFFANGARLDDPTPKGTIPKKDNPKYWNRLFHQKSDGTFEDVTEHAGLTGFGYSTGVAVGDYDNDGFEDLYVAGYGRSTLYHNNGDGTFTDVTAAAGVPAAAMPAPSGRVCGQRGARDEREGGREGAGAQRGAPASGREVAQKSSHVTLLGGSDAGRPQGRLPLCLDIRTRRAENL